MDKKIVILSGSPRKDATTDRLTAAFIRGAEDVGNKTICFRTADMKMGGCLGCGHCVRTRGVCVQKDDMTSILAALREADVLVLASPVYYFGVTAQLKLAIDRTYALLDEDLPLREAVLLITCGAATEEAAAPSVAMFRKICQRMNLEEAGIVIAPGLHEPDEINGRKELILAQQLGEKI